MAKVYGNTKYIVFQYFVLGKYSVKCFNSLSKHAVKCFNIFSLGNMFQQFVLGKTFNKIFNSLLYNVSIVFWETFSIMFHGILIELN